MWWLTPPSAGSLSYISHIAVATSPRHAGLVGPSLVFYHWPMARRWWKSFQLWLQRLWVAQAGKLDHRVLLQSSPAAAQWKSPGHNCQLLTSTQSWEVPPWKHSACADGALQFGFTPPLCADKHNPVPAALCRCTEKERQLSKQYVWRAGGKACWKCKGHLH